MVGNEGQKRKVQEIVSEQDGGRVEKADKIARSSYFCSPLNKFTITGKL